jgi:hypothetical protein
MVSAKEIRVEPIAASDARAFVRKHHYSGKVDTRSQLHLGVFLRGRLEGCMQFGPSIDKAKSVGLVRDTGWNNFLELNRLAFTEMLPRNSESRAISIAMRLIRKHAPHVEWVLSYADGTQCGDGTIYRAAGFLLTGIKKNNSMWRMPDGEVVCKIVLEPGFQPNSKEGSVKARYGKTGTETSTSFLKRIGAECLEGFQLRYLYPLNDTVVSRLTVPILPYSEIEKMGATMYRGQREGSIGSDATGLQPEQGSASLTSSLHDVREV